MSVHFIGAGPGAEDLITLRGLNIIKHADVCMYAGSLIPEGILNHCKEGAIKINTAPLSLDDIEALFVKYTNEGKDIARLHSGDLSIYSAMAEQLRRLRKHNIDYTITPGVPSFAAAAAAIGQELTIPEVAQSLILTRISGRASKMPESENLQNFAKSGATLAIHLAIHEISKIVEDLTPFYGKDCNVVIVVRATWEDQRIIWGTLATIESVLAKEPVERTALVIVGKGLKAENFTESALYSGQYARRFRHICD